MPNFLIIGAAKAATTSLSSLLEQHPEAAIVQWKEPHFFSFDKHYRLGWEAYLRLYAHCRGEKAIGDASTSYSRLRHHPQTLVRIQRHLADPKIIYMVRHPLERMESAYVEHLRSSGVSFASINEAVRRQPMIVDSSRYWEVFEAYRSCFGESRIKVVWFEDYTARPLQVFQEVCRFLGIDDRFVPDLGAQERNGRSEVVAQALGVNRNVTAIDTTWREDLRREVIETLREDNLRFLAHFGRPRDHWGGLFTA
ncbi:MAG TPA: sulfotransferase [Holophagaceae bacterium]|nr:sulfotransferase [Holophagaceae bacterium]